MDILCVFGRPIEKVNGRWHLSAYFERLTKAGQHPGVRVEDIDPNADDERIVVAGGEVNGVACAILYNELHRTATEKTPKIVIFSAGRPPYLLDDPDKELTEGSIFKRAFLEQTAGLVDPRTELVLQTQNINSYGDVVETLRLACTRGLREIAIVTLGLHIPRCREFLRHAREHEDPAFQQLRVRWFASEPIVLRTFPEHYAWLWEAMISKAHARTAGHERQGIADIQSGKYKLTAPGFTIKQ